MSGYSNCLQVGPDCPVEASIYGYQPSLGANAFFVSFFALFFFINLGLGVFYKTWTYAYFMCLVCATEAVGYGGRIMLWQNVFNTNGFIMQICCLIMGPAFNSGALYLTVKYITLNFGAEWSRIQPWLYPWIFISGDMVALIMQAVGGAMASTSNGNFKQLTSGDNIAMAGICWQVFTLFVFGVVVVDFAVRRARSSVPLPPAASTLIRQTRFQVFAIGVAVAWLTVFTRCVYRIAEFAQGWHNPIMDDQATFIVLEGVMIAVATFCQSVPHPGYCFPALSTRRQMNFIDEPKIIDTASDSSREFINETENK